MSPVNSDFNTGDTITQLEKSVERAFQNAAHQKYTKELDEARLRDMEFQANQCSVMEDWR